jgi:hypothetical protein
VTCRDESGSGATVQICGVAPVRLSGTGAAGWERRRPPAWAPPPGWGRHQCARVAPVHLGRNGIVHLRGAGPPGWRRHRLTWRPAKNRPLAA